MNIFNSVFVDCTASPDIAALYKTLLDHNVSVVASNKIAASGSYDSYRELKQTARKRDVKYLFETNVGAGLPIINTINNLINSGDKILKIEAVVSGTLNYIFNVVGADVPLSRAVRMAQEAGYSEPDPRIDLCGQDVIRKLVILAREAGYRVEQSDVKKSSLSPTTISKVPLLIFGKRYRNTMPSSNSIVGKSPIGVKFSVSSPHSTTAMSRWGCVKSIRLIRSSISKGVTMSYC